MPQTTSAKRLLRFAIPSLLGALIFLTPMTLDGKLTVLIAHLIDAINDAFKDYLLALALVATVLPSAVTLIVSSVKALKKHPNRFIQLFNPGLIWVAVRVLGAITMVLVYFQIGPEWIWHPRTGSVLLFEIVPVILTMYLLSALLLPLLTNYGLMEFVGTLLSKAFSLIFRLPGRAAIDYLASRMAATSVGILLTTQQYRTGHYSMREAAIITTNFAVASIAFSYVLLKFIQLEELFIPWYISVSITGIICALITPKLPPLRGLPNHYFDGAPATIEDTPYSDEILLRMALRSGIERADRAEPLPRQLGKSLYLTMDIAITVFPALMVIGVPGLSLIEFTNIAQTLSLPLVPILELLQLREASRAATAILSGLIDVLMPAILGAEINSELTRFVVAGVAINSVVYLTGVAVMLLRANIGLNILHLLAIWMVRILISLPILTVMGHLVVNWL